MHSAACSLPLESCLSVLTVTHLQKHIVDLWEVQDQHLRLHRMGDVETPV